MASENWLSEDFYKTLGVKEDASDSDIKKGLPQTLAQIPPGPKPRERDSREEIQGSLRSLRRALG